MKNPVFGLGVVLLLASRALTAPSDQRVLRLAGWLVGTFDNQTQMKSDTGANVPELREAAVLIGRPIQDPIEFQDAPYLYMESRHGGESRPSWQRVYRLRRSGSQVRIEVLKIDGQLLGPLGTDAQMLSSLNPGDLKKEAGCDILLDLKGDEYTGETAPRTCRSDEGGAAYVVSTLRVTKDLVVRLDRGFDEKGAQIFGPSDARGTEYRRAEK